MLHLLRLAPSLRYMRSKLLRKLGKEGDEEAGYFIRQRETGERRWQAAVAGAVGSLGLLWEDKSRRVGVSQQSVHLIESDFVRHRITDRLLGSGCVGCSSGAFKRAIIRSQLRPGIKFLLAR